MVGLSALGDCVDQYPALVGLSEANRRAVGPEYLK